MAAFPIKIISLLFCLLNPFLLIKNGISSHSYPLLIKATAIPRYVITQNVNEKQINNPSIKL